MFKALIFDFDGVITDTEPVHMEAWQGVLEDFGISFDADEYRAHYLGRNDRDMLDIMGHLHGLHFDDAEKARLIERKTSALIELANRGMGIMPGVENFIREAKGKYLLAIASGANRGEIDYILKKIKCTGIFDPIIASDSVTRGKPDPEGYIRAMEGLTERSSEMILPENILAIEDSPIGIAAAHAAGIKCLAIKNFFTAADLSSADLVVSTFDGLDVGKLLQLEAQS